MYKLNAGFAESFPTTSQVLQFFKIANSKIAVRLKNRNLLKRNPDNTEILIILIVKYQWANYMKMTAFYCVIYMSEINKPNSLSKINRFELKKEQQL